MQDPTEFRKRFQLYKEGKMPYENGLPKYKNGTEGDITFDDAEALDYILQLENPNKVGLSNGIWRPPTDPTKYDTHQIGRGLDIREEHNPIVYNYLKSKGRLDNPWLTEAEEAQLSMQTWGTKKPILEKFVNKHQGDISQVGYNTAAGMLWHGHPFKMMNNKDSITGKALLNAIASGDKDLTGVFNTYYGYGTNATKFAARIKADAKYRDNYKQIHPVKAKKSELVKELENQPQFEYWQNYHQPDYSINNPAPSSISSWNNPNSPAFNTSGLRARKAISNFPSFRPNLEELLNFINIDSLFSNIPGYKDGKSPIHINPANRGKFNATKKRTGKTTEQLAHSSNPLTRKRAIFALNARKWHH